MHRDSAVPGLWEHPRQRRARHADAKDAGGASSGCEGACRRKISQPKKFSKARQVGGTNRGRRWEKGGEGKEGSTLGGNVPDRLR